MPDDAVLVRAVVAGDREALGMIYDKYADQLLGFCVNLLRSRSDAEDCLQDVFVIAASRLSGLREPERLRSWLFAVARHECFARLDRRHREVPMDEVPEPAPPLPPAPEPVDGLAGLLADALAGLTERDRLLLELADRQQLSGDEVAAAVGVPRSTAYTLVARARTTARRSIGALVVARSGRGQCLDLDRLLTGWDGALTPLLRKQIARHVERCATCSARRDRLAAPAALLGEAPAYAAELVGLRLPILTAAAAGAAAPVRDVGWPRGWPPPDPVLRGRRRRRGLLAALLLGALLLLGGAVAAGVALSGGPAPAAGSGRASVPLVAEPSGSVDGVSYPPRGVTRAVSRGRPRRSGSARPTPTPSPSVVAPPSAPSQSPAAPTSAAARSSAHTTSRSSTAPASSASSSSAPPAVTVELAWNPTVPSTLTADVTAGGRSYQCGPGATCTWSVPQGTEVTIQTRSGQDYATFSPATTCTTTGIGLCGFDLTGATDLTLTQTTM